MSIDLGGLPDPTWYFENALYFAEPGHAPAADGPARRWREWWRQQAAGPDPVVRAAAGHGFVLDGAELERLGISRQRRRTAVARGDWSSPARGMFAPVRIDDGAGPFSVARRRHALAAAAGARSGHGEVVSGRSAAILHGLPTVGIPVRPELTTPGRTALGRRAARHLHGAALDDSAAVSWFGIPVGTIARTVLDVARHNRRDGLLVLDAALAERLVTSPELAIELAGATGWPGVKQARGVLALGSPLAGSPLESLVRLALHDDGFPRPCLQYEIAGYRVDFCWPEVRLVLEADGRGKYTDAALWREKRRESVLRSCGFHVERVQWDDVLRRWPATSRRLRAALRPPR